MGLQTQHLAVLYYDVIAGLSVSQLHEVDAVTCLILACKFTVRDDYIPLISDINRWLYRNQQNLGLSVRQFSSSQVRKNEMDLFRLLDWDLYRVTLFSFLESYIV